MQKEEVKKYKLNELKFVFYITSDFDDGRCTKESLPMTIGEIIDGFQVDFTDEGYVDWNDLDWENTDVELRIVGLEDTKEVKPEVRGRWKKFKDDIYEAQDFAMRHAKDKREMAQVLYGENEVKPDTNIEKVEVIKECPKCREDCVQVIINDDKLFCRKCKQVRFEIIPTEVDTSIEEDKLKEDIGEELYSKLTEEQRKLIIDLSGIIEVKGVVDIQGLMDNIRGREVDINIEDNTLTTSKERITNPLPDKEDIKADTNIEDWRKYKIVNDRIINFKEVIDEDDRNMPYNKIVEKYGYTLEDFIQFLLDKQKEKDIKEFKEMINKI